MYMACRDQERYHRADFLLDGFRQAAAYSLRIACSVSCDIHWELLNINSRMENRGSCKTILFASVHFRSIPASNRQLLLDRSESISPIFSGQKNGIASEKEKNEMSNDTFGRPAS